MEQDAFKIGTVVALPSGGPEMTLMYVTDSNVALAGWFAGNEYQEREFPIGALKAVRS